MEYLELSLENVKEITNKLYKVIMNDKYNYDLVIFIAKGSYPIGIELSKLANVPLLEIEATRKGGKLKKIIKPLFRFIPKNILIKLRKKEMNSDYHEKNQDRNINFNHKIYENYLDCKRILLVDDSIDSGYSIIEAKKEIEKFFKNSKVKIAVFNCMNKSIVKPDYMIYENKMICGPWSNDSKFYSNFISDYKEWKKGYEK